MYPILLQLGHFELRSYGVIVVLSFLAGLWLSKKEAARKGLDPALMADFSLYALSVSSPAWPMAIATEDRRTFPGQLPIPILVRWRL